MKKINLDDTEIRSGSRYPEPFNQTGLNKLRRRLGRAAGLTQFGVNQLELQPGAWSSQRHWHTRNDEFIYVLSGEVVLITAAGEERLKSGDCAGFKAGDPDGHHIVNRSGSVAIVLEAGTAEGDDVCDYPDIDLKSVDGAYVHRNGKPY